MKTLGAKTLKKQPTTSSPGQHKPQMLPIIKHLAVPKSANTLQLYSSETSVQLSTRNQTCSARSSELGSVTASNNNSQESVGLSHSAFNQDQVEETDAAHFFQMAPRELMEFRWLKSLQSDLPEADIEDVHALIADPQDGRQFAAEYSQCSYKEMLTQDYAIGDYIRR